MDSAAGGGAVGAEHRVRIDDGAAGAAAADREAALEVGIVAGGHSVGERDRIGRNGRAFIDDRRAHFVERRVDGRPVVGEV